jgi:hypothetical protein
MTARGSPPIGITKPLLAFVGALVDSARALRLPSEPTLELTVPANFIGVNVAPADDRKTCDYTLARLEELGVRQVRLDYTSSSPAGPAADYLELLLENGYEVLLNLFPAREEAALLNRDVGARLRWTQFLQAAFRSYQGRVTLFEVGNTPNRGNWSGFSSRSFIAAWSLAVEQAREFNVRLAGPNVSDFEPLFNATYLRLMRDFGGPPVMHTDNLFVERVIEPEAQDHRVLGRALASLAKVNLVKKARVLDAIGRDAGCQGTICTYTCWTMKRLRRRSAWPEQKSADYLLRYLLLAAASGALQRVYWGPLICNRDGLIDDRADGYPEVDQVSHYEKIRGHCDDFVTTPAFHTLGHAIRQLPGAKCRRLLHQVDGLSLFTLEKQGQPSCVVAWCRDAMCWPLDEVLPAAVTENARFTDTAGVEVARPLVINEHPLFVVLPSMFPLPDALLLEQRERPKIAHLNGESHQSIDHQAGNWRGACMLRSEHQVADLASASGLQPDQLPHLAETRILRDMRNRLWNVADPRGICDQVTVKLNRVTGIKRLTYRYRPSKGRRHWNNACQMWRRGVATPLPIAFYEQRERPGIRDSWYLCEFIPNAFSCRDVYAAFRNGATEFRGLDKGAWFELLSRFVCHMHNKQVVHRDLSSGNLLLCQSADGDIHPQVIDIGRAWIWSGPGSRVRRRHRLQDLIRICYKLSWSDREWFIERYEAHFGASLGQFWKLPFFYYDLKQRLKKAVKGKKTRPSRKAQ